MIESENKSNCNKIEALILAGIEQLWSPEVRLQIERHTLNCPDCARLYDVQRELISNGNQLSSAFDAKQVESRLQSAIKSKPASDKKRSPYFWIAAAALILAIFTLLPRQSSIPPENLSATSSALDARLIDQLDMLATQSGGLSMVDDTLFVRFVVPSF